MNAIPLKTSRKKYLSICRNSRWRKKCLTIEQFNGNFARGRKKNENEKLNPI